MRYANFIVYTGQAVTLYCQGVCYKKMVCSPVPAFRSRLCGACFSESLTILSGLPLLEGGRTRFKAGGEVLSCVERCIKGCVQGSVNDWGCPTACTATSDIAMKGIGSARYPLP